MTHLKPVAVGLVAAWALTSSGLASDASALFEKSCAMCHGKDGTAKTPIGRKFGAKDLSASKTSDAEIESQILDGKKGEDGSARMPSFRGQLKTNEVKALLEYVKQFRKP